MLDTSTLVTLIAWLYETIALHTKRAFQFGVCFLVGVMKTKDRIRFGAASSYRLHREIDGSERLNREWTNVGTSRPMHIETADFKHPHKSAEVPRSIASSNKFSDPHADSVSWEAPE